MPMSEKNPTKFTGSLSNFSDNEDGFAMLHPGKQLSSTDSSNTEGNMYHLTKFNRFNLPEGFLFMGGLRGYIFMTRPDLNIYNQDNLLSLKLGEQSASKLALRELITNGTVIDKETMSMLQKDTGFPSAYMPVFTNLCSGFSPEDQTLDVLEKGETHHGAKVKYGKHAIHSRSAGSFTLNFSDSKFLPIYKALAVWTDYIEMVFMGDMAPKEYYLKQGILDYAVSMYYIVTKADAAEIVYWDKKVGVFPKTRPDSAFATTKDALTHPEYSVTFEYSIQSKGGVLDPMILSEMNTLAGYTKLDRNTSAGTILKDQNTYFPTYDHVNNRIGSPLVNGPKIEYVKGRFYLRWI